eukprot:403347065
MNDDNFLSQSSQESLKNEDDTSHFNSNILSQSVIEEQSNEYSSVTQCNQYMNVPQTLMTIQQIENQLQNNAHNSNTNDYLTLNNPESRTFHRQLNHKKQTIDEVDQNPVFKQRNKLEQDLKIETIRSQEDEDRYDIFKPTSSTKTRNLNSNDKFGIEQNLELRSSGTLIVPIATNAYNSGSNQQKNFTFYDTGGSSRIGQFGGGQLFLNNGLANQDNTHRSTIYEIQAVSQNRVTPKNTAIDLSSRGQEVINDQQSYIITPKASPFSRINLKGPLINTYVIEKKNDIMTEESKYNSNESNKVQRQSQSNFSNMFRKSQHVEQQQQQKLATDSNQYFNTQSLVQTLIAKKNRNIVSDTMSHSMQQLNRSRERLKQSQNSDQIKNQILPPSQHQTSNQNANFTKKISLNLDSNTNSSQHYFNVNPSSSTQTNQQYMQRKSLNLPQDKRFSKQFITPISNDNNSIKRHSDFSKFANLIKSRNSHVYHVSNKNQRSSEDISEYKNQSQFSHQTLQDPNENSSHIFKTVQNISHTQAQVSSFHSNSPLQTHQQAFTSQKKVRRLPLMNHMVTNTTGGRAMIQTQASSNSQLQTLSNQPRLLTQNQSLVSIRSDIDKVRRDIFARRMTQLERGEMLKKQLNFDGSLNSQVQNIQNTAENKRVKLYQVGLQHQAENQNLFIITSESEVQKDIEQPYLQQDRQKSGLYNNLLLKTKYNLKPSNQSNVLFKNHHQYINTESSAAGQNKQTNLNLNSNSSIQEDSDDLSRDYSIHPEGDLQLYNYQERFQQNQQQANTPNDYDDNIQGKSVQNGQVRRLKIKRNFNRQANNGPVVVVRPQRKQIEINNYHGGSASSNQLHGFQSARNSVSIGSASFRTDQLIKKSSTPLYCCRGFRQCAIF